MNISSVSRETKTPIVNIKKKENMEEQVQSDKVEIMENKEEKGFFGRMGDKIKNFYEKSIKGTCEDMDYKTKHKIIGGTIGGIVGGVGGYVAGELQEAKNVTITRTYPVPVMDNKNLGQIPADWYQRDWMFDTGPNSHSSDYAPRGWETVTREGPRLDSSGSPVMMDKTETLNSQIYNKVGGTVMCAGIGVVVGVLSSVAIDIISHFGDAEETKK